MPKREICDKRLSNDVEKFIEERKNFLAKPGEKNKVTVIDSSEKYSAGVLCPIIAEGDTIGSVIFFSNDAAPQMTEIEEKLAQSAAFFLGRHMEQ